MILVVGWKDDPHTRLVTDALAKRQAAHVCLDTAAFITGTKMSLRQDGARWSGRLDMADGAIDLEAVSAVWFRRLRPMAPPADLAPPDQRLALEEGTHILDGLWRVLEDRLWVNTPLSTDRASNKPYASMLGAKAGFKVPATLLTNDPAQLKPFYDAHGGEIVYKTLSQHTRSKDGQRQGILTSRVRPQDLDRAAAIAKAPCCFQELIPKRADYRVLAIGSKLFPCEIQSQGGDRTKVDYRADAENLPHRIVALPPAVERSCREVMKSLGLLFGCIDLVETPSGDFHFLEVNPAGNWYWVEQQTGAPLLEAMLDLLTSASPPRA